jgi:biopolymer transport protein ExbB/TolQ
MSYLLLARAHWKLIGIGLLCLLLAVQTVRLGHRTNQLEREKINSNELRAELKAISTRKNEQKAETEKRVEQADKGNREADRQAERIEKAPLPGNCATPPEILGADI